MTSRERVKRAIHFQGVDRIPHYLPDGGPNDILWLWPQRAPDIQPWTVGTDGLERRVDAWGSTWVRPAGEKNHGEKWILALEDISQQADFQLANNNAPEHFDTTRAAIAENNASDNPLYSLAVMPFSSLNEETHNVLGLDRMFLAYYEEPDHLKAYIARLAEAQRESIRILADCGCDGVMGFDDWGLQDRLMVRLDMIEEFFMPHYRANWQLAHDLGMDVWLHSCGHIVDLLPKLHEWGLDVIQQDQQENAGLEANNAAAGGKLAFWCPVDIQKTMIEGSEEDIRRYVQRMMDTLGSHNGGLCSKHYPQPDVVGHAPEKTAAMSRAFRELGVYRDFKSSES